MLIIRCLDCGEMIYWETDDETEQNKIKFCLYCGSQKLEKEVE